MLRGCVDIFLATGETAFLDRARKAWEHILAHQMWVTGGISEGSAYPYETRDETCSVADWLRLSLKLWQATGQPEYMEVAEHVLLNHLAFDQDHSGGFCTFRSLAPTPTGYVRDAVAWFCCSMSGLRALMEATRFVYTVSGDCLSVNLFFPSEATVSLQGGQVRVLQTGGYPAGEPPRIRVIAPPDMVVDLRGTGAGLGCGRLRQPQRPRDRRRAGARRMSRSGGRGRKGTSCNWTHSRVWKRSRPARTGSGERPQTSGAMSSGVLPAAALRYGPLVLMLDPVLTIYDAFEPERFAITVAAAADGSFQLPRAQGQVPGTREFAVPGASFLTLCRPLGPSSAGTDEALGFLVPVAEITDRWTYTRSRLVPYEVRNDVRVVQGSEAERFVVPVRISVIAISCVSAPRTPPPFLTRHHDAAAQPGEVTWISSTDRSLSSQVRAGAWVLRSARRSRQKAPRSGSIARNGADLQAIADAIAVQGGAAAVATADVRVREQVLAAVAQLREKLGPVDILVNSAGVGIGAYIHKMTEEIWNEGWDVNVKGTALAIQAVVPDMMARKRGLIINIGSMSGLVPGGAAGTVYVGGKWALMGMSRSLSIELKPHNIRVTLLNPGTTDTPFRPTEYGKHPDWMQAGDVAAVALFVATLREPISIHEINFSPTAHGW